jgi:hypothetical protein
MDDDLQPEYSLDYSRAKPNRFAAGLLDPEVAAVLQESTNESKGNSLDLPCIPKNNAGRLK